MPDHLALTIDKFVFQVATDRLYCAEGLWVLPGERQGRTLVRVGLTDYLQQRSGDAAFVTVEPVGTVLEVGDDLAELETIKVTTTLASPVSGTIVAINDALELGPELVNHSPYEWGWLAEIEATGWGAARASLLEAPAYVDLLKAQAGEELKKS
jgi:glycine cleavage system H protein